jgi:ELWxxDGT repeat protein
MIRALLLLALLLPSAPAFARGSGHAPYKVVEADGRAFYTSNGALWVTDGTDQGTHAIDLGGALLSVDELTVVNGKAYVLAAKNGVTGLYETSGDSDARLVMTFEGTAAGKLSTNGSTLFFFIRSPWMPGFIRLVAGDGTSEGTKPIAVLATDEVEPGVVVAGRMLFKVYAPSRFEWEERTEYETWSTDGTREGTARLLDDAPRFTRAGALLYFTRNDALYRTDGTAAGTFLIAERSSIVGVQGGTLYFGRSLDGRYALWKTNGTPGSTVEAGPLASWTSLLFLGSRRLSFVSSGSGVFEIRAAEGDQPMQLVRRFTNLRADGGYTTSPVLFPIGEQVFLAMPASTGNELWRTDGTAAGTILLKTFPSTPYRHWTSLHPLGNRVLFWSDDGVHGTEPWISDGTAQGTRMVANTFPEGTIRGRVTDAATGLAVTDVVIDVHQAGRLEGSVDVDAGGRYEFEGMIGSQITLRARTTGSYVSATHAAQLTLKANETTDVDFALQLGGRIVGRVVDANGQPVANASVHIAESVTSPVFHTAKTRADGTYRTTGLPADRTWVAWTADHPGLSAMVFGGGSCAAGCAKAAPVARIEIKAGEVRNGVDFRLLPHGKFRARVIDTVTGQPLRGSVTIHVYDMAEPWARGRPQARWDVHPGQEFEWALPDGIYGFLATDYYPPPDLKPAFYPDRTCTDPCSEMRSALVAPVPGTTQTLEFRIEPVGARIAGRVLDARSGQPVGEIKLAVIDAAGREIAYAETRSDGTYETTATLEAGTRYRIRTRQTLWHAGEYYDGGAGIPALDLDPPPAAATPITLSGKEVRRGIDFHLDPLGFIEGELRDAVTGAVIPLLTVTIEPNRNYPWWLDPLRFRIGSLPAGTYTVRSPQTIWWNSAEATVTVRSGETTKVSLTLEPACRTTITPAEVSLPAAGGSGIVLVDAGCRWPELLRYPWIDFLEPREDAGELHYRVPANRDGPRAHQLVFPGALFTIRQAGAR